MDFSSDSVDSSSSEYDNTALEVYPYVERTQSQVIPEEESIGSKKKLFNRSYSEHDLLAWKEEFSSLWNLFELKNNEKKQLAKCNLTKPTDSPNKSRVAFLTSSTKKV